MDKITKEAIRYLGYGRNAVDDQTLALISESLKDLEALKGQQKAVYRIFDLRWIDDMTFSVGSTEFTSKNLGKNLKGCGKIVLFGATLGTAVDRLITRTSLTNMAKAVVLQSTAAAVLEEYCDTFQAQIAAELNKQGNYLRPRFSPGYGDFDIHCQAPIMQMLDCAKTIGLTMTDSFMMTPTKSVTAVIGVSDTQERCSIKGCEACAKADCIYRRN